jgi:hypothetical protein
VLCKHYLIIYSRNNTTDTTPQYKAKIEANIANGGAAFAATVVMYSSFAFGVF